MNETDKQLLYLSQLLVGSYLILDDLELEAKYAYKGKMYMRNYIRPFVLILQDREAILEQIDIVSAKIIMIEATEGTTQNG